MNVFIIRSLNEIKICKMSKGIIRIKSEGNIVDYKIVYFKFKNENSCEI